MLDVGCGNGRHTWAAYCLYDCQVLALDMLEGDLQKTRYTLYTADNGKEQWERLAGCERRRRQSPSQEWLL